MINNIYIKTPIIYFREFQNDSRNRYIQIALSGLSHVPALQEPMTYVAGAWRIYTSENKWDIAIATASIVSAAFAYPIGAFVSTSHDMMLATYAMHDHYQKKEYEEAVESALNLLNNCLYLALFFNGSLEYSIASLTLQIIVGICRSQVDINEGRYFAAIGELGVALLRGSRLSKQFELVQRSWAVERIFKNYHWVRNLGAGSYGKVELWGDHQGNFIAFKRFYRGQGKSFVDQDGTSVLAQEAFQHSQEWKHPAFVRIYHLFRRGTETILAMEYINGSHDLSLFTPQETREAAQDLKNALTEAYNHMWLHGDLHPGNMLVDHQTHRLRLIDLDSFRQNVTGISMKEYFMNLASWFGVKLLIDA